MSQTRFYYLDLLRVLLTMLVFYHHSAIAFGASGGWYYISNETTTGLTKGLLSASMGIDQAYFMSLFFFISAYLMPFSYDRKGGKSFIYDRLNRLGIPLLIYSFLINPLLVYEIYGRWGEPGFGPMWFVFTLLIFELSYAVYRHFCTKRLVLNWKYPTVAGILAFIIIMGISAFLIRLYVPVGREVLRLQLAFFPLYIGMYLLGIVAHRNHWLDKICVKDALPWFLIAIIFGIPLLLIVMSRFSEQMDSFSGGWNLHALFYALWEPMMCVGISYFLLAYGKAHWNSPMALVQKLSIDSYSAYFIHPVIVVSFIFIMELLPIPPLMRLILVCIMGIPCCFIVAKGIRRMLGMVGVKM